MPNTNCLEGMKCPNCGNEDAFDIVCTAVFRVYDEGTEVRGDVEWDSSSPCYCRDCDLMGDVKDFKTKAGSDAPA